MHKFINSDNGVYCYRCGTHIDYPWLLDENGNVNVEAVAKSWVPGTTEYQQHSEIHMLLPSCAGAGDNIGHHYIAEGAMFDDPDDREISAIECAYGDAWIGWETDLAYVPRYCKGDS